MCLPSLRSSGSWRCCDIDVVRVPASATSLSWLDPLLAAASDGGDDRRDSRRPDRHICLRIVADLAPFPNRQKFVAVSLNGVPMRFNSIRDPKLPTFEVRRTPLLRLTHAPTEPDDATAWSGRNQCSSPAQSIVLEAMSISHGADLRWRRDRGAEIPAHFASRRTRWRTEGGALILDNGTDTLRFLLAPGLTPPSIGRVIGRRRLALAADCLGALYWREEGAARRRRPASGKRLEFRAARPVAAAL